MKLSRGTSWGEMNGVYSESDLTVLAALLLLIFMLQYFGPLILIIKMIGVF